MWSYQPPLEDMLFVIDELLDVRRDWACIPEFADLDSTLCPQILEEAGKFATQVLAPLNARGDLEGCRFDDGAVTAPGGFADAYRIYCDAGWPALACDPASGGQGLPKILNTALYEMLNSVNAGWTMYPGLAYGAYECLRAFAPAPLREAYLPKIVSGEWLSTMCLTEPQAGSDVGLIRCRAEPRADASYAISGSKLFISGGDHDMTENIVHLVLARLPDAPPGTRGISLFLVPKFLTDGGGRTSNRVHCDGIETKLGIKGSATCTMRFESAVGWLIGEPHRGLKAMFVMMNAARLNVGMQGLGHAEMAYQNALRYAGERLQMHAARKPAGQPETRRAADPIVLQAAVRRTLLTQRAFVQGERALGYWAAHLLDVAEFHPDADERRRAHDLVSLLTPIIKAFFTENGFALSSAALQVWGGYGYLHGYGIEQSLRDSRVAMIYEGTNEIQALDLLVRKVIADRGRNLRSVLQWVLDEAERCAKLPECESFAETLRRTHGEVTRVTAALIAEGLEDPETGPRAGADFLRLIALLLLAAWWARAARLSLPRAAERFYGGKIETAKFFFDFVMPEASLRLELLERRRCPLPWLPVEEELHPHR
jgi:alkylation response protein AidB-like acyl-CoA dehydrogenase